MRLLTATLLLLYCCVSSASFVPLDPNIGKYPLGMQFEILEDPESSFDIGQVSRGGQRDNFIRSNTSEPSFGWSNSTYWIRFSPINTRDNSEKWFLEFDYAPLDQIDVWRIDKVNSTHIGRGGDNRAYKDRAISHYKHTFAMTLQAEQKTEVYVRVQTQSIYKLNATLWSEARFERHQRRSISKRAMMSGLLLSLAIYNLLIYLKLRDPTYAWFSLSLLTIFLQQSAHSGIASEWLWPNSILLNQYGIIIFGSTSFACLVCFFRSFLQSKERAPLIDNTFRVFAVYFLLCIPVSIWNYTLSAKLITYALVPSLLLDFFACFYIWYKGFKAARMLLLAWGFYMLAALLYTMTLLDWLPGYFSDYDYIVGGGSIAIILLGTALADRFLIIQRDHSDLKSSLLKESQSSDELKSTFLATISHELRTPIHGIKGCLEMTDEKTLTNDNFQALQMARQSTANLERLISRLLLFSDAVAGKLSAEPQPYEFSKELTKLTEEYRTLYPTTSVQISDIDSSCDWLMIDGKKLIMALQQLLDNACRFSSRRKVIITAGWNDDTKRNLTIKIEDSGVGMKKSVLSKASQAFTQKDQSFSRRHGGMGVGLTLTHSLIKILQGNIHIDSVWGRGTEIEISVPAQAYCPDLSHEHPTSATSTAKIPSSALVVEDNPINQKVLSAMLKKMDLAVTCANNGESAVELYSAPDSHFDIIFMDCQMPIKDGFEATTDIREIEKENGQHIPIIAVTANAMSGDKETCLNSGMDDYLAKPVTPKQIKDAIGRHIA